MAEETNAKKTLIDVEIAASDALKTLTDLRIKSEELKQEQKELQKQMKSVDTTTEKGSKQYKELRLEYEKTGQEVKNLNTQATAQQRVIQNSITAHKAEAGSAQQVAAQLNVLRAKYDGLSKAVQESEFGKDLVEQINELDESIKSTDASTGRFQRFVGEYSSAFNGFGGTIGKVTETLQKFGGGATSVGGMAKNAFKMITTSAKTMGKAFLTPPIGIIVIVLAAITAAVKALSGAFARNDSAGTKLSKSFAIFQPIITAVRKALEALANGIASLVELFAKGVNYITRFAESLGLLPKGYTAAAEAAQELVVAADNLEQKERDYTVNSAKRNAQVAKLRNESTQRELYNADQRMAKLKEAIELQKQNLEDEKFIAEEHLRILEGKAKQERDTSDETTNAIAAARAKVYQAEQSYYSGVMELQNQYDTFSRESAKEIEDKLKEQKAARDKQLKEAKDHANKLLDIERKFQEETFAYRATFMRKDFFEQQKFEDEQFESKLNHERRKLDLQKKYGDLTLEQYKEQNKFLDLQEKTYRNTQIQKLNEHYASLTESVLDVLNKTYDDEIETIDKKYKELYKNLEAIEPPKLLSGQSKEDYENSEEYKNYKKFLFKRNQIELELSEKQGEEITKAIKTSEENQRAIITQSLNDRYEYGLKLHTDNEKKKTDTEILMLKERIEALKEKNIEAFEDEAKLRELQTKKIQNELNERLQNDNKNARETFEIKQKALNDELALYEGNATKEAEINARKLENEKAYAEQRIEIMTEWANKSIEIASSISTFQKTKEDADLLRQEEKNTAEKERLEKRLNSGLISQRNYDAKIAKMDEELDKKKSEIARKQALRDKALSLVKIGIDTASAIMRTTANVGMPLAIPLNIAVGALGALQALTVAATPIPKASKGALLHGNSHANGGVMIEAEGGESIINKRSTKMFAPLLSAINEAGGGIAFSKPTNYQFADGGYVHRQLSREISAQQISAAMIDAVSALKVYTTIEDYRRADKNYTEITNQQPNL